MAPAWHGRCAARSVLAGQSTAIPKTADGVVEMMRQLKITRDTAVKARTTAMNTLKQIIVHAPPELREALHGLTDHGLLTRCAGLRPGPVDTPTASAKHTLRALARRWIALSEEMAIHDQHLARLTTETAPTLREGFGVGAHTAAELLIIFGDNPDRIRSEAAFATLCGACPIPASSGMTTGRHRLNQGGHRQANAPSIAPSSSACDSTNPPATTSPDVPPMAGPNARSSGASNASLRERSTNAS